MNPQIIRRKFKTLSSDFTDFIADDLATETAGF